VFDKGTASVVTQMQQNKSLGLDQVAYSFSHPYSPGISTFACHALSHPGPTTAQLRLTKRSSAFERLRASLDG
jgi:hypothetical protein